VPSNYQTASVSCVSMELALTRYGHALGRWRAAWRFASPELRRTVALAQISAAWDVFRRDAGPDALGPAHEAPVDQIGITSTEDPRRNGLLLWLADHASPAIADAARLLCRMVSATRPFRAEEQVLLQLARDTLAGSGRLGPITRLLPTAGVDAEDVGLPRRVIAVAVD
jgi:hypothetical protein